jgi:hypothetical protein
MPVVRSSRFASAMLTRSLVPLNDKAPPYFPVVVHVGPFNVPFRLFPELSPNTVPEPSLKLYSATRLGGGNGELKKLLVDHPGFSRESFDSVKLTINTEANKIVSKTNQEVLDSRGRVGLPIGFLATMRWRMQDLLINYVFKGSLT